MSIESNNNTDMSIKSITADEFEQRYVPNLNTIAELVLSHPDIPEEVEQSDLLGSLTLLAGELRNGLTNRVPEIVRLQEEIAKKTKQVTKLQQTNQDLFLRLGQYQDPDKKPVTEDKPKLSFSEIKAKIDNL